MPAMYLRACATIVVNNRRQLDEIKATHPIPDSPYWRITTSEVTDQRGVEIYTALLDVDGPVPLSDVEDYLVGVVNLSAPQETSVMLSWNTYHKADHVGLADAGASCIPTATGRISRLSVREWEIQQSALQSLDESARMLQLLDRVILNYVDQYPETTIPGVRYLAETLPDLVERVTLTRMAPSKIADLFLDAVGIFSTADNVKSGLSVPGVTDDLVVSRAKTGTQIAYTEQLHSLLGKVSSAAASRDYEVVTELLAGFLQHSTM